MKRDTAVTRTIPTELTGLDGFALDSWWVTDSDARSFWRQLAERVGIRTRESTPLNPVAVLEKVPSRTLRELAADAAFVRRFRRLLARSTRPAARASLSREAAKLFTAKRPVAYFSMEFAVQAALPIYAGGLGILAGDHVKSAEDLGLSLVGVGLAYRETYYRQEIDRRGRQRVVYPKVDYGRLPLEPVRDEKGREIRVSVELPGVGSRRASRSAQLRAWRVRVGRVSIYLLDADFAANRPGVRALSKRLYGGSREDRIAQEVLVGIGGVRLLRRLGIDPSAWHLNEGHVCFSALERIREFVLSSGKQALDFSTAVEAVAANTVFTTHTPVPEGNEAFDLHLARRYLAPYCPDPKISVDDFLNLGLDTSNVGDPILSMTVLAMRLSRFRNGVSALHGVVSRGMWSHLWPHFDEDEAPITSVTNGIHVPTWISEETEQLFERHIAADWRARVDDEKLWQRAKRIPDRELWHARNSLRVKLVDFVRTRVGDQLRRNGASQKEVGRATDNLLDPEAFTIGFARRFALYKRASLLFHDLQKAAALFNRRRRPVQLVYAGKPHPEDPEGKRLFERVIAISKRPEFRGKVVVLENYDADVGAALVQGVDLWLNNPVRPQEACGTSGQKVPINGGLNASILDGWWFEAHEPTVGWAFGKPKEYERPADRDNEDAADLRRVLAQEIIPLFYKRGRDGTPGAWLRMVKASMATLIPRFSSRRMLREYVERLYVPAADNGWRLHTGRHRQAKEVASWRRVVETSWPLVHLRDLSLVRVSRGARLDVDVFLAGLAGADVFLEVWDGGDRPNDSVGEPAGVRPLGDGAFRFSFKLPRFETDRLSLRLRPLRPDLPHPAELGLALEFEAR